MSGIKCKYCTKPITWMTGKPVPLNLDGSDHRTTCIEIAPEARLSVVNANHETSVRSFLAAARAKQKGKRSKQSRVYSFK